MIAVEALAPLQSQPSKKRRSKIGYAMKKGVPKTNPPSFPSSISVERFLLKGHTSTNF